MLLITISSGLPQILVRLISSYRFNKEVVNSSVANSEAATLHDAIQTGQLDHDDLVWILSTRNYFQLRETFKCYKNKYGSSIEQVHLPMLVMSFLSFFFPFFNMSNFCICPLNSTCLVHKYLVRILWLLAKALWSLF